MRVIFDLLIFLVCDKASALETSAVFCDVCSCCNDDMSVKTSYNSFDNDNGNNKIATTVENIMLYRNPLNTYNMYVYPLEFDCDIKEPVERIITTDNVHSENAIKIYVFGIPDGVSPYVNEAMILKDTVRRLYIFSNKALNSINLKLVTSYYKGRSYNFPNLIVPSVSHRRFEAPLCNFYVRDFRLNGDLSSFLEYRYFRKRMHSANVLLDMQSGNAYPFVLPHTVPCPVTLIMPVNFTTLGPKRGTMELSPGLIVHVFSKYFLKAQQSVNGQQSDQHVITDARILDTLHLLAYVKDCFARMGFLNVYAASPRQCVAYDSCCTAVVGDYVDINV